MRLSIRTATPQDADAIRDVHVASIRGTCAKDYTPEQIEAWASPKRPEHYAGAMERGDVIFVAEVDHRIVGMAQLNQNELLALYNHPDFVRRGVGRALFAVVEERLIAHSAEVLRLNSTLTSAGFYQAMGCRRIGLTSHLTRSGVGIPCIAMRKHLPASQDSTRMIIDDIGTIGYMEAWDYQQFVHERVAGGCAEEILIVEHPPVLTLGRRGDVTGSIVATHDSLRSRGIEVIHSDRGGDVTFHGPGQVVVYPIVRSIDHKLSVGGYVHRLEAAVVSYLATLGVHATTDKDAVGVWMTQDGALKKVCALGVRIRKGASLHGIALNVDTDLSFFDLIVPCGLQGKRATSLRQLLGDRTPALADVRAGLADAIRGALVRSV